MVAKLSSIKMEVPLFKNNTVREFAKWWPLFQAYAVQKEFAEVIQQTKCKDLPETELPRKIKPDGVEDDIDGTLEVHTDEQCKALLKNKMGIAAFTIAFARNVNEDCQAMVTDSKDDRYWPTGQCHMVVQELLDEFAADDEMGMIRQRVELYSISMRKNDNPKTLFSQITSIEQKYKGRTTPLTVEDKRAAILMRAPKMYQAVIQTERTTERKIHGREPTLKALRRAMYDHYKSIQINQANNLLQELTLYSAAGEEEDSSDEDIGNLHSRKKKKGRKGTKVSGQQRRKKATGNENKSCYGCGEKGHIKRDCPYENPCGYCGVKGHTEEQCWKKHPEKRPKKFRKGAKNNNDVAGIVVDEELTFTVMDDGDLMNESPWWSSNCSANYASVNTVYSNAVCGTRKINNERMQARRPTYTGNAGHGNHAQRSFRDTQRRRNDRKRRRHTGKYGNQRLKTRGWPRAPAYTYARTWRVRETWNGHKKVASWTIMSEQYNQPGREQGSKPVRTEHYVENTFKSRERPKHVVIRDLRAAQQAADRTAARNTRTIKGLHSELARLEHRDEALRQRNDAEAALITVENETSLSSATGTEVLYTPIIWIADTGASCHVTNSTAGGVPSVNAKERLKTLRHSLDASGNRMHTNAILDIKGAVQTKDGETINVVLKDCRYGASKFNLCSITKLTDSGWFMRGDAKGIHLTKGEQRIDFDIPIKTQEGKLWAARIERRSPNDGPNELTLATPTVMSLEKAHQFCGHSGIRETIKTAKYLGWKLTRKEYQRCEPCAVAKARQANLEQGETREPKQIGELYYIDGMKLKRPKRPEARVYFPANNCLVMAVEHKTGASFTGWYDKKNGFIDDFCSYFARQAENGKAVRRMRCDDAGENKLLQKKVNGKHWRLNVQFEYTAKTPQRNSRVETKLFHMSNKTRAALEDANVPDQFRYILFALFYKWCCQTDMLTVVEVDGVTKTRHEHLYGKLPGWVDHMQVAGMAGVVKTHTRTTPKVNARGKTCLFVCYATDHAKDCYVMYDPGTRRTLHSRDVLWLNRMYFPSRPRPGAEVTVEGISLPAGETEICDDETQEDGTVVSIDSDSSSEPETETQDQEESQGSSVIMFEDEDEHLFDMHEQTNSDEGSRDSHRHEGNHRVTRSGRVVRAPMQHDGTRPGEVVALHIEDQLINETCLLGVEENKHLHNHHMDEGMREEEFVLFSLMKGGNRTYSSVEHAFGYVDTRGDYRLVAAALEDNVGELYLVGATGHNYGNTAELNVMNYKQAMATVDRKEWEKAIKVEHDKMVKYNVFRVVKPKEIPKGTKLFDSTWAMKKKPDGTFRARNAIRGFMQVDGEHYDSNDKSSPVATEVGIRVCFVLTIVGAWYQHLVDVEGAFLNGVFQRPDKHKIFMKVPEAYRKWYPSWATFLLLKTQYGTVQAALQYYRECCKALAYLKFERNAAEPCVFFKWKAKQLVVFVLWVDDCCISGPKELVLQEVKDFTGLWDCKDLGELKEYVGCRVERTKDWIRLTQPVKVQRFIDEFNCKGNNGPSQRAPSTPAEPGSVLEFNKESEPAINNKRQTKYRSGVGILLHMMRWSRPDVLNAVRELSSYMTTASKACYKALNRVMNFIVATKEKGYMFKPASPGTWDGRKNTRVFEIKGQCDSEYAKHSSRRSVNAGITYLEGAIVKQFSKMMPIVALSTTEAELYSAVLTAQDMMFVYHIVTNLGLKVRLPMKLYCDNKGAVALANNWSVGGRTRHVDVKQHFLRELKERGFIEVLWRSGAQMTPDMHTKNVSKALFDQYSKELVS
ncbi:unnamed protein product [Pseudo-nitzschia multistriata]|uniref:CCHC-type domain-containing protein n=1 Tax=Pseudo-nitzschia multistriata TaxID=183589 RepID=A0A448YVU6_9STRA|nr:unnamed protein product [Pseudo-nitzschia multistriata]